MLLGINPFQFYGPWKFLFFVNAYLLTTILIAHCVAIETIDDLVMAHGISPKAQWGWSRIVLLVIYVIALGLLVLAPLLRPRAAVRARKFERLDALATRIQACLEAQRDSVDEAERLRRIARLRMEYRLVDEAYREWPVHAGVLKGFSIAALVPLISPVVSVVVKLLTTPGH